MPPRGAGATGIDADSAAAIPKAPVAGRDGLLADIRGGARLKKVSDAEKRDRSAAMVPGTESAAPPPPPSGGAPGGGGDAGGGLAGALASALAARKSKVSHSGKSSLSEVDGVFGWRLMDLQMMRRMTMIGDEGMDRGCGMQKLYLPVNPTAEPRACRITGSVISYVDV